MYPHPLLPCDIAYYIPIRYDGTICGYSVAIYSQLDDDRAIVAYEIETPYFVKPISFVITNHQFHVMTNLQVDYTDENDYAVNCLARVHFLNCFAVEDDMEFLFERPLR